MCHSELSEALEEYRDGHSNFWFMKKDKISSSFGEQDYDVCKNMNLWSGEKPEGIAIELADCIIRILDYCGHAGIDMDEAIRIKHEHNKTRPFKHGDKII